MMTRFREDDEVETLLILGNTLVRITDSGMPGTRERPKVN